MFNKSNFCHIASNNRNEQKGSVFIYKTADTLEQVTQSGYFNEKLIDINLHDLIIHVQYNPVDRTLKKSVLIVTERTLDNVETTPILDQTIGNDIAELGDQVQGIEEKIPYYATANNPLVTRLELGQKQGKLTAGPGITISDGVISASGIDVPIDTELSPTSGNPVQNAVITAALDETNATVVENKELAEQGLLTKQDAATALNYDDISNCVLEIPQDIKLELTDGTLTLKAGSKVYVPNGFTGSGETQQYYGWTATYQPPFASSTTVYTTTENPQVGTQIFDLQGNTATVVGQLESAHDIIGDGIVVQGYGFTRDTSKDTTIATAAGEPKFDEITIESDRTVHVGTGSSSGFIRVYSTQEPYLDGVLHASGPTVPSGFTGLFYNTTENIIRMVANGVESQTDRIAFPIGIANYNNGAVTAVTNVLSGFGRIGSTVFALPRIKGLIPTGRNADGTLKNELLTTTTVVTATKQWGTFDYTLYLRYDDNNNVTIDGGLSNDCEYDEMSNVNLVGGGVYRGARCVNIKTSSNSISQLTYKSVFHAVDYNDKEFIAHQAMPSNRQLDYTLGATGATYQAPADGYVYFAKIGTAAGQTIQINQGGLIAFQQCTNENKYMRIFMPVRKGGFTVSYTAAGGDLGFRFVYVNGTI